MVGWGGFNFFPSKEGVYFFGPLDPETVLHNKFPIPEGRSEGWGLYFFSRCESGL